ncbi:hypothetical protein N7445_005256 [Penicillium cf. griseofulvum]|nr:hypothetical protein N7445_005256 [Penicillium cf. griseofulvum]
MRRFERINNVVEPVEEYKPGGYHPVHLGDVFHERYEIIGKWSYGQFSTRDVTLKILKATASEKSKELSTFAQLSQTQHPGKKHVLSLLDHFKHNGPNGPHLCLVFPSMLSDGQLPVIEADSSAPEYLMVSQRPFGMLHDADGSCLTVEIGDLGGAFQANDKDSRPVTPFAMKAPEQFDGRPLDNKVDIWALGCLLFQFAINEPLFSVMTLGCTEKQCREVLRDLVTQVVGNGYVNFAVHVGERLESDFDGENTEQFAQFLWSMLQHDPQDRPSASELLKHLFLHC